MKQYALAWRRWWHARRTHPPPLDALLGDPMPGAATPFRSTEILSVDIETTGLDAAKADMLSIGWVLIRDGRVDLKTARSYLVRPSGDVGSSASVHGLTDTMVGTGMDWTVVLDKIIERLRGRVLLVHHAGLDKALLDRLCRKRFGIPLLVPLIDTLALEHRRTRRRHHVDSNSSLRLGDLRDAYKLPRYDAHDCLADAIATAELLLAMVAHHDGPQKTRLRSLLR